MNKKAAFTDLIFLSIMVFILVVVCVIFVYIGNTTRDQYGAAMNKLNAEQNNNEVGAGNYSVLAERTMGRYAESLKVLIWASWILIIGMCASILIGSYLTSVNPTYFFASILILIVSILISVPFSNAYYDLMQDANLSSTFSQFGVSNWLVLHLPMVSAIIGGAGIIIMFISFMKAKESGAGSW